MRRVKKLRVGYVLDFVCVWFLDLIFRIDVLRVRWGFFFVVVMEDGVVGLVFLGVVMSRDVDFVCDWSIEVWEVMSWDLVIVLVGSIMEEVVGVLIWSKKSLLFLVMESGDFVEFLCWMDLKVYCELLLLGVLFVGLDGKILVGVVIGICDSDKEWLKLLVDVGVNVVILDSL